MRILNIMLARVKGGLESMALYYHLALRLKGHEVQSIGHPDGELVQSLPEVQTKALTARVNFDVIAAFELAAEIRAFKPDIILIHGSRASTLMALPFMPRRDKVVRVFQNQFFKDHVRGFPDVICASASVLEAARAAYPKADIRFHEVSNFSPLTTRTVKPAPSGQPLIGALGRLHEQKGFDVLLEALARLKARGHDFRVEIAGEGPERAALEAQMARLGLSDTVRLIGWVSPVWDFLGSLDLFVVSSRYEPFGLVVIEGMAAGAPIVATRREGPLEILKDGVYGEMFANEDPEDLCRAMEIVLKNWASHTEMARKAQDHAINSFGLEAGAQRLDKVIRTIAQRRAA